MIIVCPGCGHSLEKELKDGISHCKNCNKVFDASVFNELLAVSWLIRRKKISPEQLEWQTKLEKDLLDFVFYFTSILNYSHDEFSKMLKKIQNNSKK